MTDSEKIGLILDTVQMMQHEAQEFRTSIESRIINLESRMASIETKVSALGTRMENIETKVSALESRMTGIETKVSDLKTRVTNIEISLENEIKPALNDISSCYTSTFDRYKDSVEEHETMKTDIEVLKEVTKEHSDKLQQLA